MICLLLVSAIVGLLANKLYKWSTHNHDYFERRGVKHGGRYWCRDVRGLPQWTVSIRFEWTFLRFYFSVGAVCAVKCAGLLMSFAFACNLLQNLWSLRLQRPSVCCTWPSTDQTARCQGLWPHRKSRGLESDGIDVLFGSGLFLLRGEKWRHMRGTLSPAFTGTKMRQMFQLVVDCADTTVAHFTQNAAQGQSHPVEVKVLFTRYSNDRFVCVRS